MALARRDGGRLVPWADEQDPTIAWALSEVSGSRKRFGRLLPDQETPEVQAVKVSWPDWRREACPVCPVEDEGGVISDGLLYDRVYGLRARSPS